MLGMRSCDTSLVLEIYVYLGKDFLGGVEVIMLVLFLGNGIRVITAKNW